MKKLFSIALVVVMVFALAATAFAVDSPGQSFVLNVDVEGKGHATSSTDKIKIDGGNVTFTAEDDEGVFIEWIIEGEYDIVSGDLNSRVIVITPHSDIKAVARFTDPDKEPTEHKTPDKKDDTSPKTGYPMMLIFGMMGLAMIAGVVATKKIKG